MCAPAVAMLPLAFSAGQFAIGSMQALTEYSGQQNLANQQASYQSTLASLEQERANREKAQLYTQYNQEVFARQLQMSQEKEAVARELMGVSKEARAVRSKIQVASGEAGVSGNSIDGLLAEVTRQELGYKEAQLRKSQLQEQFFNINAQNMAEALRANASNATFGSQMRIANINRPIERPNLASLGLNLFGAGLSSANSYFTNRYYQQYGAGSGRTNDLISGLFGV